MSLVALALLLGCDDWPQFRGPGGRGFSAEKDLPVEWSREKGLAWTAPLPGRGLSSPVVIGDRVYLTANSGPDQERLHVLCIDAATGRLRWERELRATGPTQCNKKTSMAAPTPAADARGVVVLFATADLPAFDPDGSLLWSRALAQDYPTYGNNVGAASSPALRDGRVYVALENVGESYALAVDARTGRNLWKNDRASRIAWTTPLVAGDLVVFQSPGDVTAYDAESGSRRWSLDGKFAGIPSPAEGCGVVYVPGAPALGLADGKPRWEPKGLSNATASPTMHAGRLYTLSNAGVLTCTDARTGEAVWKERATQGAVSASPVIADDRIYIVNEAGVTTVLALGDAPKKLGENALNDTILASPAVSNGAIYLRSDKALYCIRKP